MTAPHVPRDQVGPEIPAFSTAADRQAIRAPDAVDPALANLDSGMSDEDLLKKLDEIEQSGKIRAPPKTAKLPPEDTPQVRAARKQASINVSLAMFREKKARSKAANSAIPLTTREGMTRRLIALANKGSTDMTDKLRALRFLMRLHGLDNKEAVSDLSKLSNEELVGRLMDLRPIFRQVGLVLHAESHAED